MVFIFHFPMQEIGYFRNLLYINKKEKNCFHFCPPIVPEIFEVGERLCKFMKKFLQVFSILFISCKKGVTLAVRAAPGC